MNGFECVAEMRKIFYGMAEYTGYNPQTTFFDDFSVAEWMSGVDGVKDTFERAKEWISNEVFSAELTLVLNWKCNIFFEILEGKNKEFFGEKKCAEFYEVYYKLYYQWHNLCLDEYEKKGNEEKLKYYWNVTD